MQAERIPRAKFCCCCLALCFGVKMPSFCGRILPFFLWCVRASGVVLVRRRAVRVFAAVHRWKIVGVPDTKFCLRVGFSAPRGAGISLPVLPFFVSCAIRRSSVADFPSIFLLFFSRGDSRLPGAPESPLFFLSTLASFEVMFPPGCTQWPCLCL